MLLFRQKIIFIPALFLQILQRYYKPVILSTLGMHGHARQKHQLEENIMIVSADVYLETKNQLDPSISTKRYYTLKNPTI